MMTLPTMDKISQRQRKRKTQWRDDMDKITKDRERDNGVMTLPTMDMNRQRQRKRKRQWRDDITNHRQNQPKTENDGGVAEGYTVQLMHKASMKGTAKF